MKTNVIFMNLMLLPALFRHALFHFPDAEINFVGDPMDASGHYGVSCSGSPDTKIKEDCFKLGQRVTLLVHKLNS